MNATRIGSRLSTITIILVAICLFYPLSVGPVCWLADQGVMSDDTADWLVETVYAPLKWSMEKSEFVDKLMWAYFELWG